MGLFRPGCMDKNKAKALLAVAALKSDGQLFRAARDATDEAVAVAAAARLNDELLLEELALREPRAGVSAAGMALLRLAAFPKEFQNILRMLRVEGVADGSRMEAVLRTAISRTDDPSLFARLLACIPLGGRNACLKSRDKDDVFLTLALRQAAGVSPHAPENVQSMLWCFSDEMLLRAMGLSDGVDVAFGEALPAVVGAIREQRNLITAVEKIPSTAIRLAALQRISDQAVLLDIALNNTSAPARQTAAERLTDWSALARYAAENPKDVTEKLLGRLLRQSGSPKQTNGKKHDKRQNRETQQQAGPNRELLLAIATRSTSELARKKAFSLLTEAADISQYVKTCPRLDLDESMLRRVTDQTALCFVACGDYPQAVRLAAVKSITDDSKLCEIVLAYARSFPLSGEKELMDAALRKIRDQNLILRVMELENGGERALGIHAPAYIADEEVLVKIALKDWPSSRSAVCKINDVEKLRRIQESASKDARETAAEKLEDSRIAALALADSEGIRTAVMDASPRVRTAAVSQSDDQALLEDRAAHDKDYNVRRAAIDRLTDCGRLITLLYRPECDAYVFAIAQRIGTVAAQDERARIIEAAEENYKEKSLQSGAVAILSQLKDCSAEDVHIHYGGVPLIERKLKELEGCTDLHVFRQIHDFLRRAYRASPDCRKTLSGVAGKKYNRHYDLETSCVDDRCDVMVEVTLDL